MIYARLKELRVAADIPETKWIKYSQLHILNFTLNKMKTAIIEYKKTISDLAEYIFTYFLNIYVRTARNLEQHKNTYFSELSFHGLLTFE